MPSGCSAVTARTTTWQREHALLHTAPAASKVLGEHVRAGQTNGGDADLRGDDTDQRLRGELRSLASWVQIPELERPELGC